MRTDRNSDDERTWKALAEGAAQLAHREDFSSRRGIYWIEDENWDADVLCVYNNNPYSADPQARAQETFQFREWLSSVGIRELAFSYFPEVGPQAGYSYAMILDCPKAREAAVVAALKQVTMETLDILTQESADEGSDAT